MQGDDEEDANDDEQVGGIQQMKSLSSASSRLQRHVLLVCDRERGVPERVCLVLPSSLSGEEEE